MAALLSALRLIQAFRALHPEISGQVMEVFLTISLNEGIQQHQIADRMGLPSATISRHCSYLGRHGRGSKSGLNLIDVREMASDRRFKECVLTPAGRAVRDNIVDILMSSTDGSANHGRTAPE